MLFVVSGTTTAFAQTYGDDVADELENGASDSAALTLEGMILTPKSLPSIPFTAPGYSGSPPHPNDYVSFTTTELDGMDLAPALRGTLRGEMFDQMVEFSAFFMAPIELEATKYNLGEESGNPNNTNTTYDNENNPNTDTSLSSSNSDNIFAMTVHHQTKLFGGEANMVDPFGLKGLLIGGRAIYFGELLGATTMETEQDVPGGSDNDRDEITVRTDNRLFGLQAGLQGMFDLGNAVRLGGSVKAGIYDNEVERRRTFLALNTSQRHLDRTDNDRVLSWGVEVNPRMEVRLAEGAYLTAAGTFLWLGNVSQAVDHYANIIVPDDHDVRANRDVYFYGGSLGLTFQLDNPNAGLGIGPSYIVTEELAEEFGTGASIEEIEDRILDLEETTAKKGNSNVTFEVSGWINRMFMGWNDGRDRDVYIVDNVSSRSRLEFKGYAKIARGWSAGYYLSMGLDDMASNDVDQLDSSGDDLIDIRHSAWWIRNNQLGKVTVGLSSTATDNIIHSDTGGIMPGAANIATMGGSLIVRHADEYETGEGGLITRTTLNDFAAGASVDTLRRNAVRYDAPRFNVLGGRVYLSTAWGEDDFFDAAIRYRTSWNDWRFRAGFGYLHDTDEGIRTGIGTRDRQEFKGSASVIHVPSGLFTTMAYVRREFNGTDPSNQAVFGEETTGVVTPPGTNRPPIDYLYTAWGIRRAFSSLGDTSVYGEYAQVDDAITGLNEAGITGEVTDSS